MLTPLRNRRLWSKALILFCVAVIVHLAVTYFIRLEDEEFLSFRAIQKTIALGTCFALTFLALSKDPVNTYPLVSSTDPEVRRGFLSHFVVLFVLGLIIAIPLLLIAYILYKAGGTDTSLLMAFGLPISFIFLTALILSLLIPVVHRPPQEKI